MKLLVRKTKPPPSPKYAVTLLEDDLGYGTDIALFYDLETATAFACWYSSIHKPTAQEKGKAQFNPGSTVRSKR